MAIHQPTYCIREALWPADKALLEIVRHKVFVVEQFVPETLEWTGDDEHHRHVIAVDSNERPIGTGRISTEGKIGRMAVLKSWRGKGVGSSIIKKLIEFARSANGQTLTLSAQVTAAPFYRVHGFVEQGETYQEAGIEHRQMVRELQPKPPAS